MGKFRTPQYKRDFLSKLRFYTEGVKVHHNLKVRDTIDDRMTIGGNQDIGINNDVHSYFFKDFCRSILALLIAAISPNSSPKKFGG